jgi:hypothetical protein
MSSNLIFAASFLGLTVQLMEDQILVGCMCVPTKEELLQGDHQSLLMQMVGTHGHLASGNMFDVI